MPMIGLLLVLMQLLIGGILNFNFIGNTMADEFELTPELDIKSKNLADIIAAIEAQSAQDASSNFWVNSYATGSKAKPLDNYDDKSKRHFNNTKTFLDALLGSRARDSIEDNRLDLYNKAANQYSKAFSGDAYQEKPYQSIQDALIDMNKVDQKRVLSDWKEREGIKNDFAIDKLKAEKPWLSGISGGYGKPTIGGIGQDSGLAMQTSSPFDFGVDLKPIDQMKKTKMQEYMSLGATPTEALKQAEQDLDMLKRSDKITDDTLKEYLNKIQIGDELVGAGRSAIERAGDTGVMGNAKQKFAGLAGIFSDDQAGKYKAGQELEGLGAKFVASARIPGSGAMSDPEMRMYQQSGLSLANEEDVNKGVLDRMQAVQQTNKDYIDFVRTFRDTYGRAGLDADSVWQKYLQANPLYANVNGQTELNPNRKNWREYFARGGQAPIAPAGVPGERSRDLNISQIADDFLRLGGDGYGMEEGEVELLNTFVPVAQKMLQTDDVNLILQQLKNPEFAQAVSQQIAGQAQPMPQTGTVQAPQMDREAIKAQVKELKRQGKTDAEIKMILGGK